MATETHWRQRKPHGNPFAGLEHTRGTINWQGWLSTEIGTHSLFGRSITPYFLSSLDVFHEKLDIALWH
jgi:hypothetical protein